LQAATRAKKPRISDGATFEEAQALLLKCTSQLRALMPPGSDASRLDHIDAEQDFLAWLRQAKNANAVFASRKA
jgi:hypothetical protein